jgi:hypothetical protein
VAVEGRDIVINTVLTTELESDLPGNSRRVQFVARLTSLLGVALFVLLAVEGVSVPFTGQLLTWHVVVGIMLIPLMSAKIIVTSYRFVLYYSRRVDFKKAGPPWMPLRILGPLLIVATVVMMTSGVALVVVGPSATSEGLWFAIHRDSFIAWFIFMAVHVLAYVLRASSVSLRDLRRLRSTTAEVTQDTWYRVMIVVVVLGIGIGLSSRFGPMIHVWLMVLRARVLSH